MTIVDFSLCSHLPNDSLHSKNEVFIAHHLSQCTHCLVFSCVYWDNQVCGTLILQFNYCVASHLDLCNDYFIMSLIND